MFTINKDYKTKQETFLGMRIQFATLGLTPEVVVNAIHHEMMDELHLFTDDKGSKEVLDVIDQLTGSPLRIVVKAHKIEKFDLMACLYQIIKVVTKIQHENKDQDKLKITFNMTGGTKPMVSALLLAGYMTGAEVFYLKEGDPKSELLWIPMPKVSVKDITKVKLDMLKALGSFSGAVSLTKLKDNLGLNSVQALTNYMKFFENENLILTKQSGRQRLVELSDSGKVLYALMEYD